VVLALQQLKERGFDVDAEVLARGEAALVALQLGDGGWGGGRAGCGQGMESSVEETGLCLEALAGSTHREALEKGVEWMVDRVERGEGMLPCPIGFYFAKLWYFEKLYPMVAAVAGLGAVTRALATAGLRPAVGAPARADGLAFPV
jgi:squalene-hopene/tetraprenyl-beta-curcumene cyclase